MRIDDDDGGGGVFVSVVVDEVCVYVCKCMFVVIVCKRIYVYISALTVLQRHCAPLCSRVT